MVLSCSLALHPSQSHTSIFFVTASVVVVTACRCCLTSTSAHATGACAFCTATVRLTVTTFYKLRCSVACTLEHSILMIVPRDVTVSL